MSRRSRRNNDRRRHCIARATQADAREACWPWRSTAALVPQQQLVAGQLKRSARLCKALEKTHIAMLAELVRQGPHGAETFFCGSDLLCGGRPEEGANAQPPTAGSASTANTAWMSSPIVIILEVLNGTLLVIFPCVG